MYSGLRHALLKLAVKKGDTCMVIPKERVSENDGKVYISFSDGLRLVFENDRYAGFITQLPSPEG